MQHVPRPQQGRMFGQEGVRGEVATALQATTHPEIIIICEGKLSVLGTLSYNIDQQNLSEL